jgi:hypothetical protein
MNLTTFLDVAIGLSVMYLGAGLLVTIANEYIAQFFQLRAEQLKKDLAKLIDDPALVASLCNNPGLAPLFGSVTFVQRLRSIFPISLLSKPTPQPASFVDPTVLAQQLVGALGNGKDAFKNVQGILEAVNQLPNNSRLKTQLTALASASDKAVDGFVQDVGAYLDRTLVAMGEVYKRKIQVISLGVGLVAAVAFNLDTLLVAKHLYRDKEAREASVAVAVQITEKTNKDQFDACMKKTEKERREAVDCAQLAGLVDAVLGRNQTLGKLPIGWQSTDQAIAALGLSWGMSKGDSATQSALATAGPSAPMRWIGLFLTALAVSLGASFWFDILNRFVNMRHGMRKPDAEAATAGGTKS